METVRQRALIRGKPGHASALLRRASPPASPPVVATAKKYENEQYDDEERGVIHAAPPLFPSQGTQALASLSSSKNRHL
jgi:hypothetical protein